MRGTRVVSQSGAEAFSLVQYPTFGKTRVNKDAEQGDYPHVLRGGVKGKTPHDGPKDCR